MFYDGVTFKTTRVAPPEDSDKLDAALGLVKIELRIESPEYNLLSQIAKYNGTTVQHFIRTLIKQKLRLKVHNDD